MTDAVRQEYARKRALRLLNTAKAMAANPDDMAARAWMLRRSFNLDQLAEAIVYLSGACPAVVSPPPAEVAFTPGEV